MRRLAGILALVAAVATIAVLGTGAVGGPEHPTYSVELDNAFGLIEGGDLKVAGVRAGTIETLAVDRRTKKAKVEFKITESGFGSLRADVFCEARPQSLIGEYFVDCLPGRSRQVLEEGSTIPVEQTASTVPPDLINNIMRRPYRERLRLIVDGLGAGVAARGDTLNAAIRRAVPALRETDRVLARLARQNRVLADLARDADRVIGDLAGNREDVGRFVVEAGDAAEASAERRDELAGGFRRLPGFLRELEPTMAELGEVADAQTPALRDLGASAGELERFLDNLGPFADASRPAVRSLGEASVVGRRAVRGARPTVRQLGRFSEKTPELARNLRMVLRHLDDRDWAVEPDPRSPGGRGYTGLEALLQYVFDQSMAINLFDDNGHILKVSAFEGKCAVYADRESLREDPDLERRCNSQLGPSQPGINQPDPTAGRGSGAARSSRARERKTAAEASRASAAGKPGGERPDRRSGERGQGATGDGPERAVLDYLLAP
jgi:virulence factor Mce-like protein